MIVQNLNLLLLLPPSTTLTESHDEIEMGLKVGTRLLQGTGKRRDEKGVCAIQLSSREQLILSGARALSCLVAQCTLGTVLYYTVQ